MGDRSIKMADVPISKIFGLLAENNANCCVKSNPANSMQYESAEKHWGLVVASTMLVGVAASQKHARG